MNELRSKKLLSEFGIPVLVFAVNVALAIVTGLWIFGLAAAVIGVLIALKARHFLRND